MSRNNHITSRRTFLKATTAAGAVAFIGTPTTAAERGAVVQEDGGEDDGEPPISDGVTVALESVADGLTAPTDFQTADEEADRQFVVDQAGQVYVLEDDELEDEPFLDVEEQLVDLNEDFDERGLLGLAFHPDFEENGRFYVRYSVPPREDTPEEYSHTFVLSEFETADDNNEEADLESERTILEIPQPQANHNAGPIAFGPDGYLYIATGDGGGGGDSDDGHVDDWYDENEGGNGQDTTENLLGGILRIDVDTEGEDEPYAIPDDNPLVDEEDHLDEYYAWGLRNPWGMSFHDDLLFVADAGQERFEEVNVVEAGGNYGWNVKEGTHCFSTDSPTDPPEDCPDETPPDVRGGEPLIDPIIEYPQEYDDEVIGTTVVGGHVYESETISELQGAYVFGDWSESFDEPGGTLFAARPPGDEDLLDQGERAEDEGDENSDGDPERQDELWEIEELLVDDPDAPPEERQTSFERFILSFGRDQEGELYVLTSENTGPQGDTGEVFRITPTERENGDESEDEAADDGATIELVGVESGWEGVSPSEIEGETNPTLELEAGETYEVTWENGDGLVHNFVVENDDGENLAETELVSGFGETQTVEFEASDEMAEYYCEPHSNTMRGDIAIDSG